VDTVSADKKHHEVEADDGAERHHSSVRVDAIVHDEVPVLTRQDLRTHRRPAALTGSRQSTPGQLPLHLPQTRRNDFNIAGANIL